MAKYKVNWSIEARQDLLDILKYYIERNGNSVYSKKLNLKINEDIKLLLKNSNLGISTDSETIRVLITGDYQIIYEILETEKIILINMLWDCRRNPKDKIIG